MRIRPVFLATLVALLSAGLVGFFGGKRWAQYEASRTAETAVHWSLASQSAQSVFFTSQAISALSDGKPRAAQTLLVRYAKLQVPSLTECAKSPQCVAWVGSLMPTDEQLRELEAMRENP